MRGKILLLLQVYILSFVTIIVETLYIVSKYDKLTATPTQTKIILFFFAQVTHTSSRERVPPVDSVEAQRFRNGRRQET